MVVARKRPGHTCDYSYLVTIIVIWDGLNKDYADCMYKYLSVNLSESGYMTRRRCGANDRLVLFFSLSNQR